MNVDFVIRAWAAYAPGLHRPSDWQAWAAGAPTLPDGEASPPLAEMPAMARRRLDGLGRMAVQVAWWCDEAGADVPKVFASRYGDATRSLAMLGELARGEALSPTAFSLSVHNAVAAMYSIARGERANYTAVAAGAASVAAAVVEAAALLADGAAQALVVCYDAPLPGAYRAFEDEPSAPYAWAWRIAPPAPGEMRLRLAAEPAGAARPSRHALPFGLDVLRFSLCDDATLERAAGPTRWRWQRCDD